MSPSQQNEITVGYAEWQRCLADAYFSRPGVPTVMFVADDELEKVAPAGAQGRAAASLAEVVLRAAPIAAGASMFGGLRPHMARWRRAPSGPPPTLPVLALTVLAAARMQRDDQGPSSAYYLRLAQALLPGGPDWRVDHLRSVLPMAFQRDVAPMWRELRDWLAMENGRFGLSTVREHPHFTLIGYPLSQALVRTSDKAVLTRFFAAVDVKGAGVPSPLALMNYLRLWSSRPRGLSETFRKALADPDLSSMAEPLVAGLAAGWDGQVTTYDGRTRLDLRLVLDFDEWTARWAVPMADGVSPEPLTVQGAASTAVLLSAPDYGRYYRLTGAPPPSAQMVENGLRLTGHKVSAEFQAARIVALRQDVHAGGWTSCEAVEPYSEHVLAVHPRLATAVKSALEEASEPGWRPVRQSAAAPLLAGFELFRRVRFANEARLERALRPLQGDLKTALRPSVTVRPRLGGGLPLLRAVSVGCYLAGGEPDLYLPSGEEPRRVPVSFDGYTQELPASGFPLPLAIVPDIEAGEHVIQADGETLRFTVLDRSPAEGQAPGTGALTWACDGQGLAPRSSTPGVCGAETGLRLEGEGTDEPTLVRRGAVESWWLQRNGACLPLPEPAHSPFIVEELGLGSQYMEATPPATAAWLLQRRHRGWSRPVLLRRLAPEFVPLREDARAVLSQVFGPAMADSGQHDGLWSLYRRAWEHQRDR